MGRGAVRTKCSSASPAPGRAAPFEVSLKVVSYPSLWRQGSHSPSSPWRSSYVSFSTCAHMLLSRNNCEFSNWLSWVVHDLQRIYMWRETDGLKILNSGASTHMDELLRSIFPFYSKHMAWIFHPHYSCWEKAKTNIDISFMFYGENTVWFVYTVRLSQFLWLAMKPL